MINAPGYMSLLWAIIRPFMKKKLKDRVVMHKNNNAFKDMFSPEAIPPAFGGTLDFDFEEWLKKECEADGSHYTPPPAGSLGAAPPLPSRGEGEEELSPDLKFDEQELTAED